MSSASTAGEKQMISAGGNPRVLRFAMRLFGALLIGVCTHRAIEFFGGLHLADDAAYETHEHESVLPAFVNAALVLLIVMIRAVLLTLSRRQLHDPLEYFLRTQTERRPILAYFTSALMGLAVLYAMESVEHLHAFGHLPELDEVLGGSIIGGTIVLLMVSACVSSLQWAIVRCCVRSAENTARAIFTWIERICDVVSHDAAACARYARVQPVSAANVRLSAQTRAAGRRGPPIVSYRYGL